MEFEDDIHDNQSPTSSSSSSVLDMNVTTLSATRFKIPSDYKIPQPPHKKKAGRKIFKETRHPVYRGVRQKNSGKWVCEVREPNKKSRIWLGTFPNPEAAAVAHDVAALALRGENTPLNFPDSARRLPRAASASQKDIQRAVLEAARDFHYLKFPTDEIINKSKTLVVKPSPVRLNAKKMISGQEYSEAGNCSSICVDLAACEEDDDQRVMNNSNINISDYCGNFVDEEAMFNMPVFMDSMAEGMLLTPPAMKKGFSWSNADDDSNILELTLWGD